MNKYDDIPEKNSEEPDVEPATEAKPEKKVKPKKSKKKIWITIVVILLVLATLISVGIVSLMAWRPFDEKEPEPATGGAEPATKVEDLIDDSEPDKNTQYFLVCGVDLSEDLTDIIMVVCYQYNENRATILQIPRDTVVSQEYSDGTTKINSVYGNTPDGIRRIDHLKDCLYDQLGISIDHYVLFTIEGFRDMVDTLGGVEIDNPRTIRVENHVDGSMMTLEEGLITLDGNMAESFIRHRSSYVQGDIGRLQAQRVFYTAFAQKVLNMSMIQTVTMATKIYGDVMTDMSVGEILKYATHIKGIDLNTIEISILPGQDVTNNGFSCWTIHTDKYVELYNSMMNPDGIPFTADNVNAPQLRNSYDFDGEGTTLGEIAGLEPTVENETADSE